MEQIDKRTINLGGEKVQKQESIEEMMERCSESPQRFAAVEAMKLFYYTEKEEVALEALRILLEVARY